MKWVFRIINHSFIDVVRKNDKQQVANKSFSIDNYTDSNIDLDDEESYIDEDEDEEYDIQKQQLDRLIDSLSSDEKLIIVTYRDFGLIENGKWILPMEYKILLMEKLNIKSNSLDKKKSRIVAKLKKIIQSEKNGRES